MGFPFMHESAQPERTELAPSEEQFLADLLNESELGEPEKQ